MLGQLSNGPFSSFPKPLLQSVAEFIAIDVKIIFQSHAYKTHFHQKGFAVSLVLKARVFGTRKWPIHFTFAVCVDQSYRKLT